jgi:exosortase/archaeosortase family protein
LSTGQISADKSFASEVPQLVIKLLNGSDLTLALTWQRSGLGSIAIFTLLFLFLLFPLKGSLWRKIVWLELGLILGVIWSFIRLSIAVFAVYYLGAGALPVAEFFTGPFTDFIWMVSVWSLALSAMISAKINQVS